jgi:uncharacterized protein (TIGR02598 family)
MKMRNFKSSFTTGAPAGFSLPEVALAVAIAALSIVTLLGIIPSGLESVRAAGNTAATARIISQVTGELQLSDWGAKPGNATGTWSKLQRSLDRKWYFDDQANPLNDPSTAGFDMRLAYVVRVRATSNGVLLPGNTTPTSDMISINVDVAVTPNANYNFANPALFQTQPAVLTRQYSTE